jgi:hypothetical protein
VLQDTLSELTFGESFVLIEAQSKYKEMKSKGLKPKAEDLIGHLSEIHEANNLLLDEHPILTTLVKDWSPG